MKLYIASLVLAFAAKAWAESPPGAGIPGPADPEEPKQMLSYIGLVEEPKQIVTQMLPYTGQVEQPQGGRPKVPLTGVTGGTQQMLSYTGMNGHAQCPPGQTPGCCGGRYDDVMTGYIDSFFESEQPDPFCNGICEALSACDPTASNYNLEKCETFMSAAFEQQFAVGCHCGKATAYIGDQSLLNMVAYKDDQNIMKIYVDEQNQPGPGRGSPEEVPETPAGDGGRGPETRRRLSGDLSEEELEAFFGATAKDQNNIHGTFHEAPELLSAEECEKLRIFFDDLYEAPKPKAFVDRASKDITASQLITLLGKEKVNEIIDFARGAIGETSVVKAAIRHTYNDGSVANYIDFHSEQQRLGHKSTMIIPLNKDSDISGGELSYLSRDGATIVERTQGKAIAHKYDVVHGVMAHKGSRVSLFISLDHDPKAGAKDLLDGHL